MLWTISYPFVIDNCPAYPHIDNLKQSSFISYHLILLPRPNQWIKVSSARILPQECCPENYSKSREEENPSENSVAARNANVSLSLGCTIDINDRELLSKVWNIHRKPGNRHSRRWQSFPGITRRNCDFCSVQPNLIEEDFDATTFVDVDAEVVAVQPSPSDTEIVVELLEMEASVMMMIIIPVKLLINHKNALIKISCCKLLRLCRGSPYF